MGGLCLPNVSKTMVSEEPTMQNHVQNSALPVLLSLEVLRSFSKTPSNNLLKSPCLSPGLSLRLFPSLSPHVSFSFVFLSVSLSVSIPDPKSLPKSPKSLPAWMPRLGQFWFHGCDYFRGKSEVASISVPLAREWEACVWFQRNRRCRTMSKIRRPAACEHA